MKLIASEYERSIIDKIVVRATNVAPSYARLTCAMDITACHLNGMTLDLQRLADADEHDFVHDIYGIHRHIDRETGKLTNCFVPRFRLREERMDD